MPLVKSRNARIDNDFRSFLLEYATSGVFPEGSEEVRIIRIVARSGLDALGFEQMQIWYDRVLPILSKPLAEQVAVSRILRNGGRVPARVDHASLPVESPDPFPLAYDIDLCEDDAGRSDMDVLLRITRELRRNAADPRERRDDPQAGAKAGKECR